MTQKLNINLSGKKFIWMFLSICFVAFNTFGEIRSKVPEGVILVSEIDSHKAYAGQWVTLTVTLFSDSPDISSAYPISNPNFSSLSVYEMGGDRKFEKKKYKGKDRYSVVVARWCVCSESPGKFKIDIPDFYVGIPNEEIVDTFWGKRKIRTEQKYRISSKPVEFKVNEIPPVPNGFDFSGAVGKYEVELWVPAGEVGKDQEAIAMVSISGIGSLKNASIPKVLPAFQGGDVKLKNVSEERKNFIKNNSLHSEIELQCSFIPLKEGQLSLGSIKFGYFDTAIGKYRYAESSPVSFDVSSSETSGSSSPVIIGI